jgi:hypothetical protein
LRWSRCRRFCDRRARLSRRPCGGGAAPHQNQEQ